jgi:hypothetical protein
VNSLKPEFLTTKCDFYNRVPLSHLASSEISKYRKQIRTFSVFVLRVYVWGLCVSGRNIAESKALRSDKLVLV